MCLHNLRIYEQSEKNKVKWEYILSVNEKSPLLKFRYFESYKRNLDNYFTLRVSGQLQTRLEQ